MVVGIDLPGSHIAVGAAVLVEVVVRDADY